MYGRVGFAQGKKNIIGRYALHKRIFVLHGCPASPYDCWGFSIGVQPHNQQPVSEKLNMTGNISDLNISSPVSQT